MGEEEQQPKKKQAQEFLEDNCYERHGIYTWHIPSVRGITFADNTVSQVDGKQISFLPISFSQGQIHAYLQSLLLVS